MASLEVARPTSVAELIPEPGTFHASQ